MQQVWSLDELIDVWTLLPDELELVSSSKDSNRLGLAVMLKAFQHEGKFPYNTVEVPQVVVEYVARQVEVPAVAYQSYDWRGRSSSQHRSLIREQTGFRTFGEADVTVLIEWLCEQVLPREDSDESIKGLALQYLRLERIEPPSVLKLERYLNAARRRYETQVCQQVFTLLNDQQRERLEELLKATVREDDQPEEDPARVSLIHWLRTDSVKPGLDSVEEQIAKLQRIRVVGLTAALFEGLPPAIVKRYRERTGVETPSELRVHPPEIRLTQLAAFCHLRSAELTDSLIDHLIYTIHNIGARAERRVDKRLLADFKRVENKNSILFRLVEAALANPEGRVKDVIFAAVGEEKLRDLLKEFKANNAGVYQREVHATLRASYRNHYRRMIPWLLESLTFKSNNAAHQPVIEALELLKRYAGTKFLLYHPLNGFPWMALFPATCVIWWSRKPTVATSRSTASTTKSACWKPCVKLCVAVKSG